MKCGYPDKPCVCNRRKEVSYATQRKLNRRKANEADQELIVKIMEVYPWLRKLL